MKPGARTTVQNQDAAFSRPHLAPLEKSLKLERKLGGASIGLHFCPPDDPRRVGRPTTIHLISAVPGFERGGRGIQQGTPLFFDADWTVVELPTRWAIEHTSGTRNTIWKYARYVREWLEQCNRDSLPWQDATFTDLRALRAQLDFNRAGAAAINARFDSLANFYRWAANAGHVKISPFPNSKARTAQRLLWCPESTPDPRFIPPHHVVEILAQLPNKYRLAAEFACTGGLREAEITCFEWTWLPDQIDTLGKKEVKIQHPKRKGNRRREFFLPVAMLDKLWDYFTFQREEIINDNKKRNSQYKPPSNLFLATRTGQPIVARRLSKEFAKACLKCGFKGSRYVFHGLKHTFAILTYAALAELAKQGVPIDVEWELSRRLGHSTKETVRVYISKLLSLTDDILEQLSPASAPVESFLHPMMGYGLVAKRSTDETANKNCD